MSERRYENWGSTVWIYCPELFIFKENILIEPKRQSDLNLLKPSTKKKFDLFFADAKSQGLNVFPFETLRTIERQKRLYGQGRPEYPIYGRAGKVITWTLDSRHLLAEAVDIVFDTDPSPLREVPSWNGDYQKLIEIGKKYGLDNLAPKELCHFQDNGKPLSPIDIIMNFYKKTWTEEYSKLTPEQRVFGSPEKAVERISGLPQDQQLEELIYLLAILTQKAK